MAIVHEASATAQGSSTAPSVSKPTGTASGDVLVFGIAIAASSTAVTAPSGLTELSNTTNTIRFITYYRVCDGTEGSSFTWSLNQPTGWAVGCSRFSGCDATPSDATASVNTGSDSSAECTSVTTATANAMVVALVGANRSTLSFTEADGMTEAWEISGNRATTLNYVAQASAGATGDKTISMSNSQAWVGVLWALQPAAVSGVTLTVADAAHAHAVDAPTLTQAHALAVADAAHGHTADAPTLTQAHSLTVADATHAHAVDAPTLTQAHTLVVDDAAHGHAVDNVDLSGTVTLVVADATHAHAADAPSLTQAHTLAVADAAHVHSADALALTQVHVLAVADAAHSHAVDALTLAQTHLLLVTDVSHGHTTDAIALTQAHTLVVADAIHVHMADIIVMAILIVCRRSMSMRVGSRGVID